MNDVQTDDEDDVEEKRRDGEVLGDGIHFYRVIHRAKLRRAEGESAIKVTKSRFLPRRRRRTVG